MKSKGLTNGVLLVVLLATFAVSDAKCPHLMALGGAQRALLQASAPAPMRVAPELAAAPGPAAVPAVKSGCNGARTHPYVGYQGDLTMMDHNVGGHISILDDCTFRVTGFNYDGLAPAAHWWGGNGLEQDQLRKGIELDPVRLDRPLQNADMTVQLPTGVTWNNISVISVWCEEFLADFGHVILAPGNISSLAPAPAPANAISFDHCVDLSPNFFQMQWKLDNPDPAMAQAVIISYSAFLDANMWMGFGYSSDSATSAEMIGSDVVIAGMVGEQCFAYSYYLTAKEQCNYEGGQNAGVCPISGLLGKPHSNEGNSARLISCNRGAGNLVTVTFTRPLKASNKFEHDWPVAAAKYAVWGVGPLSQGSTAAQPVVLFHAPSNKGPTYAASDFKLSLGAPSQCKAILTPPPAGSAPAPTAATKMMGPQLLDLTKSNMIEITTGTNKNYPNPPAWGLSLHVNGLETPVVRVTRGVTYTFVIKAGETHPIYITDNINGGGEDSDIIYGGSDSSMGTVAMPFTFTWTPNMTTPDTVFYQCYAHRKLGWILQVRNPDGSLANIPNPNKVSVTMLAALPAALTDPTTLSASTAGAAAAPAPADGAAGNSCRAKFGTGGSDDLYAHCVTLTQDAADVRLNWRLDTLAGRRDMTALLQCSNGNGWCAWGLPRSPGQMVGTSAMVVRACSTCPTGAEVEQYYLASKSESGVQPDLKGIIQVMKSEAVKLPDGSLQALFTVRLPDFAVTKNYICDSIGASGLLSSTGGLARHDSGASFTALLDLAGGSSTVSATSRNTVFPVVHGIMMVVAWCMLLPISVMIARTCKHDWPPAWFQIHRALGVIAVAMIAAGLGLGIKAWDGVELTGLFTAHLVLGFLAIALAALQVTALVYRPKLDAPIRWLWATCHKWTGRKALLVTFANAIIGFNLPDVQLPAFYSWGLAIIWAAIFLAGAGKEVYSRRSLRHKAQRSGLAFNGDAANGKLPHGTNGSTP